MSKRKTRNAIAQKHHRELDREFIERIGSQDKEKLHIWCSLDHQYAYIFEKLQAENKYEVQELIEEAIVCLAARNVMEKQLKAGGKKEDLEAELVRFCTPKNNKGGAA